MQILEIQVPDNKIHLVRVFLQELGIAVKVKAEKKPNAKTLAAMEELKTGKGQKFNSVDELFNSIA